MQVLHRKIAGHARTLRITEDIVDDIEPYLRKDNVPMIEPLIKAVDVALADVRGFLDCFDYFTARCAEAGITPDDAANQWTTHAPADFLATMRDWLDVGPNAIKLVDELILAPMGRAPCPEEQIPTDGADDVDDDD